VASFVCSTAVLLGIFCIEIRRKEKDNDQYALQIAIGLSLVSYTILLLSSFGVWFPSPVLLLEWLVNLIIRG